jgi:hypothetical protein
VLEAVRVKARTKPGLERSPISAQPTASGKTYWRTHSPFTVGPAYTKGLLHFVMPPGVCSLSIVLSEPYLAKRNPFNALPIGLQRVEAECAGTSLEFDDFESCLFEAYAKSYPDERGQTCLPDGAPL